MENSQQAREGLDFIVEHPEYVKKLAAALDATGPGAIAIKKQMFELLAALCAHCEEGRARALETLEHHKKLKNERHRLNFIVQEIDRATVVDYQTSLVAFINCLIISTPRLIDRIRLRNEFIGCHLLPVLNNLRKYAEAEPELAVQLDVFDEQRESDDHQCMEGPHGVDLNSPLDVFYAILSQVNDTPQETHFMSILQHLLRIDPKEPISDVIWETAEKLVHRASLLDKREDAPKILRTPSTTRLFGQCQSCQHRTEPSGSNSRRTSLTITNPLSPTRQATPPPPPIAPNLPPPPPPPPNIPAPPPPMAPLAPPPPASFSANGKSTVVKSNSNGSSDSDALEKLPQQDIPAPKIKMKTINWNKIPNNKVIGTNNIWTQVADRHQKCTVVELDWSEMEGLFCQSGPSAQSSPKLGKRDGEERKIRHENHEITLLDGKRSLNVNIFLKQFRSSNETIIHLIREGLHDEIGTEKLKGFLKMLPEVDELDMLKSFKGDFNRLGNAEKFLIQLTDLSNYKLRIESMLLKEEFALNMNYLEPSISSMIAAAQDLMTNKPLQEVLYMILCAGNFLNAGGYAGDAAGVKLSSLQKITDIRANKPNMNLIHFVALQAEKRDKNLLSFTDNIGVLEDAAKMTVEQLMNEINALEIRLQKIKKQIELPTTEPEIKEQMHEFLLMAEHEVANLQIQLNNLECVRRKLAEFFCEDPASFKIEECFRIFHGFYTKFKQAATENERRRIQEEQANARRKQREELLATRRKQMESLGQPDSDGFIEMQIYDAKSCQPNRKVFKNQKNGSEDEMSIASSPSFSRKRLGSFNGNNADSSSKEDRSPDITPNGSLRRRRSRVLSEEDEGNLMDFLKASGTDTNRDRKSWGSLDRSWARKARGSGPRKRPPLLTADFSSERERPSSPSPLTENKPIVSSAPEDTPEICSKPKEWAQKIESWLRTSDSDNQSDDQHKRQGRKIGNKKSLDDSESERSSTLDTLPEGKQVYSGSQSNYRKVNPTWKPSSTLDKMDIMSAMETVEEVQPPPVKDKSAWRKSTLNVASTSEPTLPRSSKPDLTLLDDNNDRKHLISSLGDKSASDRLTLYFRRPSDTTESKEVVSPTPPRLASFGYATSRSRNSPQNSEPPSTNNAEIDQDNIETPPATRKMFVPTPVDKREPVPPTPCKRHGRPNGVNSSSNGNKDLDDNDAGDGQFDRFSAARRTRRYKRPTESTDTLSPTDHRSPPQSQSVSKSPSLDFSKPNLTQSSLNSSFKPHSEDTNENIQRSNYLEQRDFEPVSRIENNTVIDRLDRRSRNKTTDIGIEEIKLARQLGQQKESEGLTKDFISPENIKKEYKFESPSHKHKEPDRDEGFEETQSLMSESPSQKTSSDGANYESESFEAPIRSNIILEGLESHVDSGAKLRGSRNDISSQKSNINKALSNRGSLARRSFVGSTTDKSNNKLPSTLSSRNAASELATKLKSGANLPRRSESMRSSSNASYSKPSLSSIQKSNSRNSILSSRSSLNSNTSVNTVKQAPIKPVASSNLGKTTKVVQRTPSTKKLASAPQANKPSVNRSSSVTSTSSNSNSRSATGRSSMSFMKPTTASATKINPVGTKPAQLYRGRW